MGGLGYKLPVEILPEHVLVRAADCVVWWAPAQERTMFFDLRGGDKALKALNGKRFPHPAMVFKVTGHTLWVRALVKNERPIASTPVYMAPYWNCYANGTVCLGTMRIPQEKDPTAVYGWEESFYQSAFSHAAGNTRACRYPGGFLAMWSSLKGKKCFPIDYLNPVKQTLKDFVENNDGNYSNQLPGE